MRYANRRKGMPQQSMRLTCSRCCERPSRFPARPGYCLECHRDKMRVARDSTRPPCPRCGERPARNFYHGAYCNECKTETCQQYHKAVDL